MVMQPAITDVCVQHGGSLSSWPGQKWHDILFSCIICKARMLSSACLSRQVYGCFWCFRFSSIRPRAKPNTLCLKTRKEPKNNWSSGKLVGNFRITNDVFCVLILIFFRLDDKNQVVHENENCLQMFNAIMQWWWQSRQVASKWMAYVWDVLLRLAEVSRYLQSITMQAFNRLLTISRLLQAESCLALSSILLRTNKMEHSWSDANAVFLYLSAISTWQ